MGVCFSFGCSDDGETDDSKNGDSEGSKTEATPLTEDETADLVQLREEEKLARDVYLYAYEMHGAPPSSRTSATANRPTWTACCRF
jgi:hypothetical protein